VRSDFEVAHESPHGDDASNADAHSTIDSSAENPNVVEVGQDRTVLIVSGLSGAKPRAWKSERVRSPLWAAVVAKQVTILILIIYDFAVLIEIEHGFFWLTGLSLSRNSSIRSDLHVPGH
jgi:hypothetical protein